MLPHIQGLYTWRHYGATWKQIQNQIISSNENQSQTPKSRGEHFLPDLYVMWHLLLMFGDLRRKYQVSSIDHNFGIDRYRRKPGIEPALAASPTVDAPERNVPTQHPARDVLASTSSDSDQCFNAPEVISPFPKAAPRKHKGGRKKGKTLVLTDTPRRSRSK